jgi:hypothetical protein
LKEWRSVVRNDAWTYPVFYAVLLKVKLRNGSTDLLNNEVEGSPDLKRAFGREILTRGRKDTLLLEIL